MFLLDDFAVSSTFASRGSIDGEQRMLRARAF
jgi:hypothetical protein